MPVFTGMIIIIWISQNSDLFLEEKTLCVIDTSVKQKYSVIVLTFLPWNKSSSKMILFFAGWLVVGGAVFSFLLLFCVSSEIASVHLLMQNVQKRQRIRRSRPQLVQRANGAGSCLWSARCLPSVRCLGPALLSKQGMGETARHPAMPRLFGWGGVIVWRWDSGSGSRKLSDTSRGWFSRKNDFWPPGSSVESVCYSTTERSDCLLSEVRTVGDSQSNVSAAWNEVDL